MGLCQGRNLWYFICVGPHRLSLSNGNSGTPRSVGVDKLGCGSGNFRRLAQVVNSCVRLRRAVDRLPLPRCQPRGVPRGARSAEVFVAAPDAFPCRSQVPCYSYGQKLSKLAILRIACNYILSLARLADLDYSADHSNLSFSECVQRCTRTLQAEGRAKKRKVCTCTQVA